MGQNQCMCITDDKKQQEKNRKKKQGYPGDRKSSHYEQNSFVQHKQKVQTVQQQIQPFRQISLNDFEIIKVIGKGAFGKVFLVREKKYDKVYAMKTIVKSDIGETDKNYNKQERQILTHMDSDFIVKLYYAFQDPFKLYMILDFVDFSDLSQHIKKRGKFQEEEVKFIMCEILIGLEYLHKKGVIYRDLKPSNILIQGDGHIKLADFGISKIEYSEDNQAKTFCGTYQYMAPEIFLNQEYGPAADWYSFGVTMYELLTGKTPFDNIQNASEDIQKEYKQREILLEDIDNEELKYLLGSLMDPNPKQRLTNIKSDPYFVSVKWDQVRKQKITPVYQPENHLSGSGLQISQLENSNLEEDNIQESFKEEGYFVNFSFNHENKELYEANEELGDDSEDENQNFSKFKFQSRRETLTQPTSNFSLYKQTEIKSKIQRDSYINTNRKRENSNNSDKDSHISVNVLLQQSKMSNSNGQQKVLLTKQNSLKRNNKKSANSQSFQNLHQICVIKDAPYEETRRQYSVEYNQDMFLMYQNNKQDNQSQLFDKQKNSQSNDQYDFKQLDDIINDKKQNKTLQNEEIQEVYRQSEETADQ